MIAPPVCPGPVGSGSSPERPVVGVALDSVALGLALLVALAAATIGLHVFSILGIVPGAELLGLVVLGGLGLLPRASDALPERRQVLVRTAAVVAVVAATLGQALPLGAGHAAGRPELASLLLAAAWAAGVGSLAMAVVLFGRSTLADSAFAPPVRVVVQDRIGAVVGGWRVLAMFAGTGIGQWGSGLFGPPLLTAFGVALLGNSLGLAVMAVGIILWPVLPALVRTDVDVALLPHGLLVGAGLAGLSQAVSSLVRRSREPPAGLEVGSSPTESPSRVGWGSKGIRLAARSADARRLLAGLTLAIGLYALLAELLLATVSLEPNGIGPVGVLALGLLGGLLALGLQLFAGLAGTRLGRVPTLGCCLVALVVGRAVGGPPAAMLALVTVVAASGPTFAELVKQHQAGAELSDPPSRAQQVWAGLIGLTAALIVVAAWGGAYFAAGFVPPVSQAIAATFELVADPSRRLAAAPWIFVGYVAQWLGGPNRQVGVLFASGLLIGLPAVGWALLSGLALRIGIDVVSRARADRWLPIVGIGCIGGELLRLLFGR